jgi:hypothetical protein
MRSPAEAFRSDMTAGTRAKALRGLAWLGLGLVLLASLRFGWGYLTVPDAGPGMEADTASFDLSFNRKNYASEKSRKDRPGNELDVQARGDKYEKIGTVGLRSSAFEKDERRLRDGVEARSGIIQFEQSAGLSGHRRVQLAVGVPPEQFDALVELVKGIGTLGSIRVDKTDKTSEYRSLRAQKASLEKALGALHALATEGGQIEQKLAVQARLLELEKEAQELGVAVGEFDDENELCTVKISLVEEVALEAPSLLHRAKVAVVWTVKAAPLVLAGLLGLLLCALLAFKLKDRFFKPA